MELRRRSTSARRDVAGTELTEHGGNQLRLERAGAVVSRGGSLDVAVLSQDAFELVPLSDRSFIIITDKAL